MVEPSSSPEVGAWVDIGLSDLAKGLEVGGFADMTQVDDFSVILARQMLAVAIYGSSDMAEKFDDHPAVFNHPSRRSPMNTIERAFQNPVIQHAYSLEAIQVECTDAIKLKYAEIGKEAYYGRLYDFRKEDTQRTIPRVRLRVGALLRSQIAEKLIGRAEVDTTLELFTANRKILGTVAVRRHISQLLFRDIKK